MTHTMDELNNIVPGGVLTIETACGCTAKIHLIERYAHIEYCPVHKAAPQLLDAAELALTRISPPCDVTWDAYLALRAAIAEAKGSDK